MRSCKKADSQPSDVFISYQHGISNFFPNQTILTIIYFKIYSNTKIGIALALRLPTMRLLHGAVVEILLHRDGSVQAVESMQLLESAGKGYLSGAAGVAGELEDPAIDAEVNEADDPQVLAAGHVRQDCRVILGAQSEELEIGHGLVECDTAQAVEAVHHQCKAC